MAGAEQNNENDGMNIQQLGNELWEAADQLRANSKLAAAEYATPVLGLIFLRHADKRFKAYLPEIEADIPPQMPAREAGERRPTGRFRPAAKRQPDQG